MLIAPGQDNLDQWKSSLYQYQRRKRTKRPFGKQQPSRPQPIRPDEMRYNPVIQSFRDELQLSKTIQHQEIQKASNQLKYIKNNYKYSPDYNIINMKPALALHSRQSQSLTHDNRKKQYKDPTYYSYNIINGNHYDHQYLEKRAVKQDRYHPPNIQHKNNRSFNIISGNYQETQDISSSKFSENKSYIQSPYQSQYSKRFDPVLRKPHNPEAEEQQLKYHPIKLPPSYINRQALTLDPTIPASPIVQTLEQQKERSKQRYKMRYIVEDQYKLRNQFDRPEKRKEIKNRVPQGLNQLQKIRQLNMINSKRFEESRQQQLFGKEITEESKPYARSSIKYSGFNQIQQ